MESLLQDVRFAVRTLWKSPGFVVVAVLSLALGIGANTAIFTVVKAVFLQPLPLVEPDRLVALSTVDSTVRGLLPSSYLNLRDYRERVATLEGLAIYGHVPVSLQVDNTAPEPFSGEIVSGNYFALLGAKADIGRTFSEAEDGTPGQSPVLVLSHGTWIERFGGDANAIGKTVALNRHTFTIIGVMPKGFKGLNGLSEPGFWAPLSMGPALMARPEGLKERRALYFYGAGRLKGGVSLEQAQSSFDAASLQLAELYPDANQGRSIKLRPIREVLILPQFRRVLENATLILMTIVGFVLLIATANVASLVLVRARGRTKEFAIRLAIGAGQGRLARQMLTESLILSLAGGLVGLLFAKWGRDLLWLFRPPWIGGGATFDLTLDWKVLAFTFCISLLAGAFFGLFPAWSAGRRELARELRERTASAGAEHRIFGVRPLLVIGQCALSVVALVGAGLFMESLRRLQEIDPGFETKRLAILRVNLAGLGLSKEQGMDFTSRIMERVGGLPGVRSASFSDLQPLGVGGFLRAVFAGENSAGGKGTFVFSCSVASRFFETAGIRVLEGREIAASDREDSPKVVLVNASFAKRFWPGESAVGRTLRFQNDVAPRQVVGVVSDTKFHSLTEEARAAVFIPLRQEYMTQLVLLVKTDGSPQPLLGAIRQEVLGVDRNLALANASPMEDVVGRSLWAQRLIAGLLSVFGGLALLLSAIGVYGLASYAVTQRTNEIGIRMALGAMPGAVVLDVLKQGMVLVAPGLLLGLIAALVSSRVAASMLFGIGALHPPTYIGAGVLIAAVAALACLLPALRAAKVDPLVALRHE